jgi:hypothetical protein
MLLGSQQNKVTTSSLPNSMQHLDFDERTRVAEILSVFGNCVAIVAGVTGVFHEAFYLRGFALLAQLADVQPMSFRVFAFCFDGF